MVKIHSGIGKYANISEASRIKKGLVMQDGLVREIFYFQPENFGYRTETITSVHLLGEFNSWGENKQKLEDYCLLRDRTGRWIGVFDVKSGREPYKFLINHNTYCPDTGELYYSTTKTCKWAQKAIWYQILPDRFAKSCDKENVLDWNAKPDYYNNFGGDLKGIEKKLDYFKDLYGSLDNFALYLNPIMLSSASNHKYWPEDFSKVDPQFGSEKDLKKLINSIHKQGGKVIFDLVYNHSGLNHPAFMDILKNGDESKYFDWYRNIVLDEYEKIEIPVLQNWQDGNWENISIENDPREDNFNPKKHSYISVWGGKYKFPITHPTRFKNSSVDDIINDQPYYKLIGSHKRPNYKCWFEFFEIPELNAKNEDLKTHLFECAKKWIALGVDGFRLDVPDMLNDAHKFWADFREAVNKELKKQGKKQDEFYILGEIWTNDEITNSFLNANEKFYPKRFDAIMNYPIREIILNFLSGEILEPRSDRVQSEDEICVSELDSLLHKNFANISFNTDKVQFNCFSTHDTRRLRSILADTKKLKTAITMQFTMVGSPTIYYGDEIGLKGGVDPDNRATMKWDIVDNLDDNPASKEIFELYQNLIKLRQNRKSLSEGLMLTLLVDDESEVYAYARYSEFGDCSIVVVSKNDVEKDIVIDLVDTPFEFTEKWRNALDEEDKFFNQDGKLVIKVEQIKDNNLILIN